MGRTRSVARVCQNGQVCNDGGNASSGHAALTRGIRTSRRFHGLRHTRQNRSGGAFVVYWVRTVRNTQTGKTFEVASDERYLPRLRNRIVQECGYYTDWKNEDVYEHEAGLDMQMDGGHPQIVIEAI